MSGQSLEEFTNELLEDITECDGQPATTSSGMTERPDKSSGSATFFGSSGTEQAQNLQLRLRQSSVERSEQSSTSAQMEPATSNVPGTSKEAPSNISFQLKAVQCLLEGLAASVKKVKLVPSEDSSTDTAVASQASEVTHPTQVNSVPSEPAGRPTDPRLRRGAASRAVKKVGKKSKKSKSKSKSSGDCNHVSGRVAKTPSPGQCTCVQPTVQAPINPETPRMPQDTGKHQAPVESQTLILPQAPIKALEIPWHLRLIDPPFDSPSANVPPNACRDDPRLVPKISRPAFIIPKSQLRKIPIDIPLERLEPVPHLHEVESIQSPDPEVSSEVEDENQDSMIPAYSLTDPLGLNSIVSSGDPFALDSVEGGHNIASAGSVFQAPGSSDTQAQMPDLHKPSRPQIIGKSSAHPIAENTDALFPEPELSQSSAPNPEDLFPDSLLFSYEQGRIGADSGNVPMVGSSREDQVEERLSVVQHPAEAQSFRSGNVEDLVESCHKSPVRESSSSRRRLMKKSRHKHRKHSHRRRSHKHKHKQKQKHRSKKRKRHRSSSTSSTTDSDSASESEVEVLARRLAAERRRTQGSLPPETDKPSLEQIRIPPALNPEEISMPPDLIPDQIAMPPDMNPEEISIPKDMTPERILMPPDPKVSLAAPDNGFASDRQPSKLHQGPSFAQQDIGKPESSASGLTKQNRASTASLPHASRHFSSGNHGVPSSSELPAPIPPCEPVSPPLCQPASPPPCEPAPPPPCEPAPPPPCEPAPPPACEPAPPPRCEAPPPPPALNLQLPNFSNLSDQERMDFLRNPSQVVTNFVKNRSQTEVQQWLKSLMPMMMMKSMVMATFRSFAAKMMEAKMRQLSSSCATSTAFCLNDAERFTQDVDYRQQTQTKRFPPVRQPAPQANLGLSTFNNCTNTPLANHSFPWTSATSEASPLNPAGPVRNAGPQMSRREHQPEYYHISSGESGQMSHQKVYGADGNRCRSDVPMDIDVSGSDMEAHGNVPNRGWGEDTRRRTPACAQQEFWNRQTKPIEKQYPMKNIDIRKEISKALPVDNLDVPKPENVADLEFLKSALKTREEIRRIHYSDAEAHAVTLYARNKSAPLEERVSRRAAGNEVHTAFADKGLELNLKIVQAAGDLIDEGNPLKHLIRPPSSSLPPASSAVNSTDARAASPDNRKKFDRYTPLYNEWLIEKRRRPAVQPDWRSGERRIQTTRSYPDMVRRGAVFRASDAFHELEAEFVDKLLLRSQRAKDEQEPYVPPARKVHVCIHHRVQTAHSDSDDSSDGNSTECSSDDEEADSVGRFSVEMKRKKLHPYILHKDLWYNEPGERNDGPECHCSIKSRRIGIRHKIFPGEEAYYCDPDTNNADKLFHYKMVITPLVNFRSEVVTKIPLHGREYIFDGFSMFSHYKLGNVPNCKAFRYSWEYSITFIEENMLDHITVRSMDFIADFIFRDLLELFDLCWKGPGEIPDNRCPQFHFMPRFICMPGGDGKGQTEMLCTSDVMKYLLDNAAPLVDEVELQSIIACKMEEYQPFVDNVIGSLVTKPGMHPSTVRLDQLDRHQRDPDILSYPVLVHFGRKPMQLTVQGNPRYQKAYRDYRKLQHLLANKPKVTEEDRNTLKKKEQVLNDIRTDSRLKKEVTVEMSSQGFCRTGLKSDIAQHALIIPILVAHLRFHKSLAVLEGYLDYKFKDRYLLHLALVHPSFRTNYGTNADHVRNSMANCGFRVIRYGTMTRYQDRKKGINTLIEIMSRMAYKEETVSEVEHYERLENLGDAVVEFVTTRHLYFLFQDLEEGGLATYRTALVQNRFLATLAKCLHVDEFMLFSHGPDLCHDAELKHAMANVFEAIMAALFLDGGLEAAEKVYANALFGCDSSRKQLLDVWNHLPVHPLQADEPDGDRHWIQMSPVLQKINELESSLGLSFKHIRILARAFTMRNVDFNNLTLGHNQRLEFLGDAVLQIVVSDFLYRHFPDHQEGHLSLLRSSLVNNQTQAQISMELGLPNYLVANDQYHVETRILRPKEKADLLEALLGAIFVDTGDLDYIRAFCEAVFFPRLEEFILNQSWNDAKSMLQQCCLTLRTLDDGDPSKPTYKLLNCIGPPNSRLYKVAVYFRHRRLAAATGRTKQVAEMLAASKALKENADMFPQLRHQKRILDWKYNELRKKNREMEEYEQNKGAKSTAAGTMDKDRTHRSHENKREQHAKPFRMGGRDARSRHATLALGWAKRIARRGTLSRSGDSGRAGEGVHQQQASVKQTLGSFVSSLGKRRFTGVDPSRPLSSRVRNRSRTDSRSEQRTTRRASGAADQSRSNTSRSRAPDSQSARSRSGERTRSVPRSTRSSSQGRRRSRSRTPSRRRSRTPTLTRSSRSEITIRHSSRDQKTGSKADTEYASRLPVASIPLPPAGNTREEIFQPVPITAETISSMIPPSLPVPSHCPPITDASPACVESSKSTNRNRTSQPQTVPSQQASIISGPVFLSETQPLPSRPPPRSNVSSIDPRPPPSPLFPSPSEGHSSHVSTPPPGTALLRAHSSPSFLSAPVASTVMPVPGPPSKFPPLRPVPSMNLAITRKPAPLPRISSESVFLPRHMQEERHQLSPAPHEPVIPAPPSQNEVSQSMTSHTDTLQHEGPPGGCETGPPSSPLSAASLGKNQSTNHQQTDGTDNGLNAEVSFSSPPGPALSPTQFWTPSKDFAPHPHNPEPKAEETLDDPSHNDSEVELPAIGDTVTEVNPQPRQSTPERRGRGRRKRKRRARRVPRSVKRVQFSGKGRNVFSQVSSSDGEDGYDDEAGGDFYDGAEARDVHL